MPTNQIDRGDALHFYKNWPSPTTIISDGAYGIGGFDGDPKKISALADWYAPHIEEWTKYSTSATSLWFWNTEVGWATVHPLLISHGWQYVQLIIWNKGIGHIAGNVNGNTIRRFPVVSEVSALYVRPQEVKSLHSNDSIAIQDWLRNEWKRAGFTLVFANTVCGVKNAASRKWLTGDSEWYMPSFEMFSKMREYANLNGRVGGLPYFESNEDISTESKWARLRSKWNHHHGMTNVWDVPSLRNSERIKGLDGKFIHTNQKPLELMRRQINSTTDIGDAIWEPFGGLCSASVAAQELQRDSCAAEVKREFYKASKNRLKIQTK